MVEEGGFQSAGGVQRGAFEQEGGALKAGGVDPEGIMHGRGWCLGVGGQAMARSSAAGRAMVRGGEAAPVSTLEHDLWIML